MNFPQKSFKQSSDDKSTGKGPRPVFLALQVVALVLGITILYNWNDIMRMIPNPVSVALNKTTAEESKDTNKVTEKEKTTDSRKSDTEPIESKNETTTDSASNEQNKSQSASNKPSIEDFHFTPVRGRHLNFRMMIPSGIDFQDPGENVLFSKTYDFGNGVAVKFDSSSLSLDHGGLIDIGRNHIDQLWNNLGSDTGSDEAKDITKVDVSTKSYIFARDSEKILAAEKGYVSIYRDGPQYNQRVIILQIVIDKNQYKGDAVQVADFLLNNFYYND